jgi:hypothetical protein
MINTTALEYSGNYMYRSLKNARTLRSAPHSVCLNSVWSSQQTAIISTNSINRLGFVFETQCVLYEERQACRPITQMNCMLHRVKAIITDISVLWRGGYSVGPRYRSCHQPTNNSKPGSPDATVACLESSCGAGARNSVGLQILNRSNSVNTMKKDAYSYIRECPYFKSKPKLCYDLLSVGQSIFVSGTHLGPVTNFPFLFS